MAGLLIFGEINSAAAFDQPWNGGREDITRPEEDEEEECEGNECNCPNGNNTSSPVYSARGYLVWKDIDIEFTSNTLINLSRTYNSFDFRAGLFGRGWMTAQESSIARTYKALTEGNADGSSKPAESYESIPIWAASYGRRYQLEETETGCTTPNILYFTFEKTSDGGFKQVFENSNSYVIYSSQGQMVSSYSDKGGVSVYYEYDDQNRLIKQVDSYGFGLEFGYNDAGFVSTVKDQAGRQWYYIYDEFGRLLQVQDPDGNSKDYAYQVIDNVGYKQHLLIEVNNNLNDPVLRVTWSQVGLYGKQSQRVKSYTESDGRSHEYTYSQATYQGVQAVKVVKNTKQVNSTTIIESHTIYAEAATYQILSVANTTKGTNVSKKYNALGRLTEETDERGNTTIFEYDDQNRKIRQVELAGTANEKVIIWTYYSDTDRIETINEYGVLETRYAYDGNLRITLLTQTDLASAEKRIWTYAYYPDVIDTRGNPVLGKIATIDGPLLGTQDIQTFTYNSMGQLARVDYPLSQSVVFTYNQAGQLASHTDTNGIVTTLTYDSHNRVTKVERNDRVSQYIYTAQGQIAQTIDELGRVTQVDYDIRNQPVKVTFPGDDYLTFTYGFNAQYTEAVERAFSADAALLRTKISRTKPESGLPKDEYLSATTQKVSEREYNSLNEVVKQTFYGQFGSETTSVSTFDYDLEGRLHRIIDGQQGVTLMDYDAFGRLTKITAPNQAATVYSLNAWGEVKSLISPDTGNTNYIYDSVGNLTQKTDAEGRTTRFNHDALHRVTSVDYDDDNLDVVFNYDEGPLGKGLLTSVVDGSGNSHYQYDDRGLVTQAHVNVAGVSLTVGNTYNAAGQVTDISYPSGLLLNNQYDAAGRLSSIELINGNDAVQVLDQVVWRGQQLASHRQGNALVTTYIYDGAGRLTEKRFGGASERFQHQFDNQDNILQKTEVRAGQSVLRLFKYDRLSRLTHDETPGSGGLFSYDGAGNRTSWQKADGTSSLSYTYEANSNRLNEVSGENRILDATGNTLNDGINAFTYSDLNRMRSVANTAAQALYTYNFKGERVRKQITGNADNDVRFVYGQEGELLGEYDSQGRRIREILYWYEGDLPEPIAQVEADGRLTYLHTDHLATPRLATDSSQAVIWRWASNAFGEGEPSEDVDGDGQVTVVNLRFPGQYFDQESGIYYNYFRDYSPELGRYLQSDVAGLAGGLNTYNYALANPLKNSDPSGLYTTAQYCVQPYNWAACVAAGGNEAATAQAARAAARAAAEAARKLTYPDRKRGKWICTGRADCNDNIPGNCPDDPMKRFAFGTGVATNLGDARNEAKSTATHALGCQPKHVSCKCVGPKGETYSGGC